MFNCVFACYDTLLRGSETVLDQTDIYANVSCPILCTITSYLLTVGVKLNNARRTSDGRSFTREMTLRRVLDVGRVAGVSSHASARAYVELVLMHPTYQ